MNDRRSRRDLLTGWVDLFRGFGEAVAADRRPDPESALYPPGEAVPAERFLEACTGCGACVEACVPGSIVTIDRDDGRALPVIEPRRVPCYLCEGLPCVEACPEPALIDPGGVDRVRMGMAQVDPKLCVTFRGETCTICYTACPFPDRAIMLVGGRPVVTTGGCVGCGLCEFACPTRPRAIRVHPERHLVPGLRIPKAEGPAG